MPGRMRWSIIALAYADFVLAAAWERFLRRTFPAALPPVKGYLAYRRAQCLFYPSNLILMD